MECRCVRSVYVSMALACLPVTRYSIVLISFLNRKLAEEPTIDASAKKSVSSSLIIHIGMIAVFLFAAVAEVIQMMSSDSASRWTFFTRGGRLKHMQDICWRKVPDCAGYPILPAGWRAYAHSSSERSALQNVNLMGLDKFFQLVHHFDLYAMYSETFKTWVGIKNTDNLENRYGQSHS